MANELHHYRGYAYQLTPDNDWALYLTVDRLIYFVDETELREYVDAIEVFPLTAEAKPENIKCYYIYRLHKLDKDYLRNYQYYTGKGFVYNSTRILYMTETEATKKAAEFRCKDPFYLYYVSK